jgi:succinate dehydrogenase/fumarate reductase flavoprotein subunit
MRDLEVDVVVVGYGGAGAAAAITAHDAGAQVLLLEKNGSGGGNTRISGGSIRTYTDRAKAVEYTHALCEGATDVDIIRAFVEESAGNGDWIARLGGTVVPSPAALIQGFPRMAPAAAFPHVKGADGIGPRLRVTGTTHFHGLELWKFLAGNVESREIPVLRSTPARRLIREPSGEISGVVAGASGDDLHIRARRGVILACGGFEYSRSLQLDYLGQEYCALGDAGCTGDGVRMAVDVGADLWHMSGVAACFGYKFPDFEWTIGHKMPHAAYIYVDQAGRRFMDEPATDMHTVWFHTSFLDPKTLRQPRVPSYVIFDESTRAKGTVGSTAVGIARDSYEWSRDNMAEIRKGWIATAATWRDLAVKLGLDPGALATTVERYNGYCQEGTDADFGRPADTLAPLVNPPFYAIALWPTLLNTQGGPRRNARAQVIGVHGSPIRRLYSAGELGSLWNRIYPGGGNISEALAFGRIAGKNAASESPLGAKAGAVAKIEG